MARVVGRHTKASNPSRLGSGRQVIVANAPVAVNLTSQALGLVQYLLLISWNGANRDTDYFFLLLSWTALPLQLIVTGVAFPLMLRGQTGRARKWFLIAVCGSPVFVIPPILIMRGSWASLSLPIPVAALTLIYSIGVLLTTYTGLRTAASGNAHILSAATIFGSFGSIAGLLIYQSTGLATPILLMLAVAIIAQFSFYFWSLKHIRSHSPEDSALREADDQADRSSAWFLGKSIAGYGGGLALQGFSSSMPPSFLSYFSVSQRVIGGVAGAYSNSVLPRFVHHRTSDAQATVRFSARLVALICLVGAIGAAACMAAGSKTVAGWILCAAAWMASATFAAAVQRLAYRLLPPSTASVSMITCVVVVSLVAGLTSLGLLSAAILIAGVIALDAVTAIILTILLAKRSAAAIVGILIISSTLPGLLLVS